MDRNPWGPESQRHQNLGAITWVGAHDYEAGVGEVARAPRWPVEAGVLVRQGRNERAHNVGCGPRPPSGGPKQPGTDSEQALPPLEGNRPKDKALAVVAIALAGWVQAYIYRGRHDIEHPAQDLPHLCAQGTVSPVCFGRCQ